MSDVDDLAVTLVAVDGMRMPLRGADLHAAVNKMRGRITPELMAWRLCLTERSLWRVMASQNKSAPPRTSSRRLHPCGTNAAYLRHIRHHEKPCAQCLDARRIHRRNTRKENPRTLTPCGTRSAYSRHRKRGEKACPACLAAQAEYSRKRRAKKGH